MPKLPLDSFNLYNNKKLSIYYVLRILTDYSDANHPLTYNEIAAHMQGEYNLSCERKTIAANLDYLIDLDYDIVKLKKGCYLGERDFEKSELRFLVDALFSSKTISANRAKEISKKLFRDQSMYEQKQYNYIYKASEVKRTSNQELFYTIDIICEAIATNHQVSFTYERSQVGVQMKKKSQKFIVNPYFLINKQGNYYIVCNNSYFATISNYRLEYIKNIKILDTPRKSDKQLPGYENGLDIVKYANDNIYMFQGESCKATLKVLDSQGVNGVEDWFHDAIIYEKEGITYAKVNANEQSLVYWCLQYGRYVELIEPLEVREKIYAIIKEMEDHYKKPTLKA
ncbi:MAG: WYL domain-containing protein [Bacilli bacterium]|nr:WYL domain-containing protein [Bacilli bacterium]